MANRDRFATWLLLTALASALSIRAFTVFTKPVFYHDESHSYQVSTGHAGDTARVIYQHTAPYGRWVQASEWQRLLQPEKAFCFAVISADTLAYDVHPPLYYWLLHVACLAFGTHYWTGPLLNTAIDAVTIFAIYGLARYAIRDPLAAAMAAFVWAVGAAATQVCVVEARQYSLLTLLAISFCHHAARLMDRASPRFKGSFILSIGALAGALTHHHFALIAAGVAAWYGVSRRRAGMRQLLLLIAAVALAYAALLAIHPFFGGTGYKHLTDATLPDSGNFARRARQGVEALSHVILERRLSTRLPAGIVIGIAAIVPGTFALAACLICRRRLHGENPALTASPPLEAGAQDATLKVIAGARSSSPAPAAGTPSGVVTGPGYPVFLGVWLITVTLGLYLVGVSPAHAMSYRYLAMMWPLWAIALAFIAFRVIAARGRQTIALLITCGLALVGGVWAASLQWHNLEVDPGAPQADRLLRTAHRVVIDNVGRGHWPRPMWRVPADAQVYVAAPNDLLKRPALWRQSLQPGTIYISPAQSATAAREKVVRMLSETFEVTRIAHLHGIGDVYQLSARPIVRPRASAIR